MAHAWTKRAEKHLETLYYNTTVSFKPIKTFLFGQGEMMGRAHDIEAYYLRHDFIYLNMFLRNLISEAVPHWHPHCKKQQELIDFCAFLLNLQDLNMEQRKAAFEELQGKLDKNHELGRFIEARAKRYARV